VTGAVRVETAGGGHRDREPLDADEFGERVERALDPQRAGVADLLGESVGCLAEHPGRGGPGGDADRAVPVLHGRVRLGPGQRGLAHLQAGLAGQPDRPAAAEEAELRAADEPFGQWLRQGRTAVGDDGVGVQAEVRAEQGEGGGGEPGLHDGAFVGEVQHDEVVGGRPDGGVRVRGDRRGPGGALQPAEQVQDFGGGAGAGEGDDPVVAPSVRELGGGERVGLALPGGLAQHGRGLRHEVGRTAPDDRDPLPRGGQRGGVACRLLGGTRPALGLAVQFVLDVRHPRLSPC
jgi:hypothetical protein